MSALRRFVRRFAYRLQVYANAYERELKRKEFARIADVDSTTNFGSLAQIGNPRGHSENIRIGKNCAIHGELLTLPQGGKITMGDYCFVGQGSRIWSLASIQIGSYVLISHGVNIIDNISHSTDWRERRKEIESILPSLGIFEHQFNLKAEPIEIEDDVWIGFGSSIHRGVHIGRGAIIGYGTVVTDDVPAFATVVGNPMRILDRQNKS